MFEVKTNKSIVIHVSLITVVLFNAFASSKVFAQATLSRI